MQNETQVSAECEEHLPPQNNLANDGESLVVPSSSNDVVPQPAKKPTRQWAAWTREEEESFFTALRQVGKNFEKITCRVQSKNKDQVRHYYYRLVRRMNKLLGPGFCLDAKNSKDTNAAMLRWWSLLEKYSCKASKLHLKPRRFKIFIEALEHQLLKDRKKNVRKRSAQGENCSVSSPTYLSNQNKPSGTDTRAVKFVLVDSQNIQKTGNARGSSMRRSMNMGPTRSICKGDISPNKVARQRRKPGCVSAAAMKRWEKAAMDGVSLVADAAEHLERTAGDKDAVCRAASTDQSAQAAVCNDEQSGLHLSMQVLAHSPNAAGSNPSVNNVQNTAKLKLQLFPIDDGTRRMLEMDNHNPHLELTLSTRKKVSSILEHLNRKWGNSRVACGELMLFPYSVQRDNLMQYQRWTRDSIVSAADVYAIIGNPPVFRLRYGWIPAGELQSAVSLVSSHFPDQCNMHDNSQRGPDPTTVPALQDDHLGEGASHYRDQQTLASHNPSGVQSLTEAADKMTGHVGASSGDILFKSSNFAVSRSWQRSQASTGTAVRETEDMVDQRVIISTTLSPGEWADSLTNISVGDLLTEASNNMDADCIEPYVARSSQYLEGIPFSCDSFDAAIAAHISSQQNKVGFHSSSIWDAEETCDAFLFQRRSAPDEPVPVSSLATVSVLSEEVARSSSSSPARSDEDLPEEEAMPEDAAQGDGMGDHPNEPNELENPVKDFSSLTDIYWPDSLGPLELDVPSCRYYSEDLILSDSLGGLNRIIGSSLDGFQSCSFFSLEKKEPSSAIEAQGGAAFKDVKVGGGGSSSEV
ncbi:TSL-kinase interacting protein [Ancistrocladus abbreviatus]